MSLHSGRERHWASPFQIGPLPSLLDSPRFEQGGTMPDPTGIGPLSLGRRRFLAVLTGGLLAAPLMAEAQQVRVYRIGVVLQGGPYFADIDGLRDSLKEVGLVEGKHFVLDVRDTK